MSLILEALKKSEEQRRLGEMPNLGTPITATRRRRRLVPWAATAVVIAIAAVGGWRFLQRGTAPAPTPAAKDTQPIRAITKPETNQAPAPTAPRALPKPVAPPPPVQTAATTPPPAAAPAARKDTPPPVSTPAPAPAAAPAATAPAPAVATPAPAPAPAPPANDVPSLDDLPAEVRGALPQLPISMQVYSPDPKRRFVIIDGKRVVEGDSLRGVTVQEIRPTGLVIDFQGRRVLLPRPGS